MQYPNETVNKVPGEVLAGPVPSAPESGPKRWIETRHAGTYSFVGLESGPEAH